MPARSRAQVRKMYALYRQGKITRRELSHYQVTGAGWKRLPERVKAKKRTRRKKRKRRS